MMEKNKFKLAQQTAGFSHDGTSHQLSPGPKRKTEEGEEEEEEEEDMKEDFTTRTVDAYYNLHMQIGWPLIVAQHEEHFRHALRYKY